MKEVGGVRGEILDVENVKVEAREGDAHKQETQFVTATDACGNCGKREVKMSRCPVCKVTPYCGTGCQKADWRYEAMRLRV